MVNIEKLRAVMERNGDSITSLAKKMGISRQMLSAKLRKKRDFLIRDIQAIAKVYDLNEPQVTEIFFPNTIPTVVAPNGQRVPVIEMGKPVPDWFLQWLEETEAAEA